MSSAGSSSEAATAPKSALTERELEILKHTWSSLKSAPEVDYAKLAAACGMTNPRSASNAWSVIKKKLFSDLPAQSSDSAGSSPAKRKTATPSKRKAATAAAATTSSDDADELAAAGGANLNSDGEEKLVVETPAKKKRATPAKKKAAATPKAAAKTTESDENADEEAEPETPVKKKVPAAKRKTPAKTKNAAVAAAAPEKAASENEEAADGEDAPAADVAKLEVKDEAANGDVEMSGAANTGEI
ncbi:hypothetical protein CTAM01_13922 [Colletotrichum tamarilloi]|uniref:Uncharacterized protein n=1 Tax=Colletotrichum tamarilloi TaxID=1209934 RepID=A0ABQ9QQV4_9PEZI|nr:uncharacterized protein CTAM01_13922 [Colletotrichum tamarilloi]KAK1481674.1 hypothetical protein CTAM01_13922 [Colletotrichum tamarilloi]